MRTVRLLGGVERLAPRVGGVTLFELTDRTMSFILGQAQRQSMQELFAVCASGDASTRRVLERHGFEVRNPAPQRKSIARWAKGMRKRHGRAVIFWARWA